MQAIPSIFTDKINVDAAIAALRSNPVVSFVTASTAIKKQKELRRHCALSLAIHKVDPLGPGSPTAMAA